MFDGGRNVYFYGEFWGESDERCGVRVQLGLQRCGYMVYTGEGVEVVICLMRCRPVDQWNKWYLVAGVGSLWYSKIRVGPL